MTLSRILLAVCAAAALSCGGGGPKVQPTQVFEDPMLTCPDDIAVLGHNGQMPTVSFDTPEATKGFPPITVVCAPESGTQFQNGTTTVTCEATDLRTRKASCSFLVEVTPIPQLQKTKFLAFGDSLTEGKNSLRAPSIVVVPTGIFNSSVSYVERLNAKLTARYQDQSVTLVADGWGGEEAGQGKLRLTVELATHNPDALLLLEGTNDLLKPETATSAGMQSTIDSVVDALRNMINQGKSRGARVFVATLLPLNREAHVSAGVASLNDRIRSLAAQESVVLVDLHAAVPSSQIGADGIHPKAAAYDIVAEEWLKAIVATMEVRPSTLQ